MRDPGKKFRLRKGVQNTRRHGTSGHGLAGMLVLGRRLDLMILGVFSNLNDSMILWKYIVSLLERSHFAVSVVSVYFVELMPGEMWAQTH